MLTRYKKAKDMKHLLLLMQHYEKLMVVLLDNVKGNQLSKIRIKLRGRGEIFFAKNTIIKKVMKEHSEQYPQFQELLPSIERNVALVFTNENVREIRQLCEEEKIQCEAKPGQIADKTIIIEPGYTGQDPTKTSFFQAMNISTKIMRGMVEIVRGITLLEPGQRVGQSEATLLKMLNMKPFTYGMKVKTVCEEGRVYSAEVLDLGEQDFVEFFKRGVRDIAAIGLSTGLPNKASVPHSMANGLHNILSIPCATSYTPSYSLQIKDYLNNPEKYQPKKKPGSPEDPYDSYDDWTDTDDDFLYDIFF